MGTHPDSHHTEEDFVQAKGEPYGQAQKKRAAKKSLNPVIFRANGILLKATGFQSVIFHKYPVDGVPYLPCMSEGYSSIQMKFSRKGDIIGRIEPGKTER